MPAAVGAKRTGEDGVMSPRRGMVRPSASAGTTGAEVDLLLGDDGEVWKPVYTGPPAAGRFEDPGPDVASCAAYLAGLDEDELAGLLGARPDLRRGPVPRGVRRLAERMCGPGAVSDAIATADRDQVRLTQAIGACGGLADVATATRLTGSTTELVEATIARLVSRGLAWPERGGVRMPAVLAAQWTDHVDARAAAALARATKADQLRPAVAALGLNPMGRLKKDLEQDYAAALADLALVRERVVGLGDRAVDTAILLGSGAGSNWMGYEQRAAVEAGADELVRAGLGVRDEWRKVTVPREVAVAAWLCRQDLELTGPPAPPAAAFVGSGHTEATTLVRAATALLDEASARPLSALKAGGIGAKERARLAGVLGADVDAVALLIDLATHAGLLTRNPDGYAPTARYPDWRAEAPGRQWSSLAIAWFGLDHAPGRRRSTGETVSGREVAPPLPACPGAGGLRRALLRAAAADGGRSVSAVVAALPWLYPVHPFDPTEAAQQVAACLAEASVVGVLDCDALTELGAGLVAAVEAGDGPGWSAVDALAEQAARVLIEESCSLVLQSDLTAMVTGKPDPDLADLLVLAATNEARGNATVWRFSPAGVRVALDHGWDLERILAVLARCSGRDLPQPLEYLVRDVARQYGHVRIRTAACVLTGDQSLLAELAATRALRKFGLTAVAPTVLVASAHPETVLEALRSAGLFPVLEDRDGVVRVEGRSGPATLAAAPPPARPPGAESALARQVPARELARSLRVAPTDAAEPDRSPTWGTVARTAVQLGPDEVDLLAHAIENKTAVRISYVDRNGSRSVRAVTPLELYGHWIAAWCHLRDGEREFALESIGSVGTV